MNVPSTGRASATLQALLFACFALFSLALCLRCFAGREISRPFSIRSPLNVESFIALSFLLLLLLRRRRNGSAQPVKAIGRRHTFLALCFLGVLCIGCFGWALSTPFLSDDFGHLGFISRFDWRTVSDLFFQRGISKGFRPFVYLTYYLDFRWAHFDPFLWHCWNLCAHFVNSALVYLLARKLKFSGFAALVAGAVFAVGGSRAETLCWTVTRFDSVATFLVLAALLCWIQYALRESRWWLIGGLLLSVLAYASKESSFCLPLLPLALAAFYEGKDRRKLLSVVPPALAACGLLFAYRWWMVGGIGGYETGGHADVLNLSFIRTVKALLWRTWALLFFPINWAGGSGVRLGVGVLAFLSALALILIKTRVDQRKVFASLAFTIVACLPVQHLLLIGSDAAGSRFLYLPGIGFSLLWAAIVEAKEGKPVLQFAIAAGFLLFNITALEHNVRTWREVAQQAQQVCRSFGREIATVPGKVVVAEVPTMYRGVYFLSNGFPQCVEQNSGIAAQKIEVAGKDASIPPQTPLFTWNPGTLSFQKNGVEKVKR